jgi:hypothetical protein
MPIGDLLYILIGGNEDGKIVLDVSDPTAPKPIEPPNPLFFEADTLADGDAIYVVDQDLLKIFKQDNLTNPVSEIELNRGSRLFPFSGSCRCVWKIGDLLFVEPSISLSIVDVHDITHPEVIAFWDDAPQSIGAYGDMLYFQMDTQGVMIFKLVPN